MFVCLCMCEKGCIQMLYVIIILCSKHKVHMAQEVAKNSIIL